MTDNSGLGRSVGVVGGGVIGLCTAFYLRQMGWHVTVIEREKPGFGAGRGSGGLIVSARPLPGPGIVRDGLKNLLGKGSAFYVAPKYLLRCLPFLTLFAINSRHNVFWRGAEQLDRLNNVTHDLFEELHELGIGTSLRKSGRLLCFRERGAAEKAHSKAMCASERGVGAPPGPLLGGSDLHECEPILGGEVHWGFKQDDVWWVSPPSFLDELVVSLRELGVSFIEGCEVTTIREVEDVVEVRHEGGVKVFEAVLVAAGGRSQELVRSMNVRIPLEVGLGYSFTVKPQVVPRHVIMLEDAHVGLTPLDDERVRVAGTMEFSGGFAGHYERLEAIVTAARALLKGVDWSSRDDYWHGGRPMTPDGMPYIGRIPRHSRSFIATGHNMVGVSLAPATGRLVAGIIGAPGRAGTTDGGFETDRINRLWRSLCR